MKTNSLVYNAQRQHGNLQYDIHFRLDDKCKNGHQDFSVTGEAWPVGKKKTDFNLVLCGAIGNDVAAVFPDLEVLTRLHLCDWKGTPIHATANGAYFLKNGEKQTAMNHLRITESEYEALKDVTEEGHLAILLVEMGIKSRWEDEARKAIAELERLTESEFLCDSTRDCWVKPESMDKYVSLHEAGYYSPVAVTERSEAARLELFAKARARITEHRDKAISKATTEAAIALGMLNLGILSTNYIWYDHTNVLKFNWMEGRDKFTPEQIALASAMVEQMFPEIKVAVTA